MFERKQDAERFLTTIAAEVLRGPKDPVPPAITTFMPELRRSRSPGTRHAST